jgi:CRISPR system Cascade subunit CasD
MNSATVVLLLHGPLQSWGASSRFDERATESSPTKSGVIGLLAASQGRPRGNDISDLARLQMSIRVDRSGQRLTDYQTVGANYPTHMALINAEGKPHAAHGKSIAMVTRRHYLSDAAFLVAITGTTTTIHDLDVSLRQPVWTLSLGRRSCPPAEPFLVGVTNETPLDVFQRLPLYRNPNANRIAKVLLEDPAGVVMSASDQPQQHLSDWASYRQRRVTHHQVTVNETTFDPFDLIDAFTIGTERHQ